MTEFFEFENFSWGLVIGLFVVVVLLSVAFFVSAYPDFFDHMVPIYTLLGFVFSIAIFEAGLIVYMHGVNRGTFHKENRQQNLVLRLNAVKNARKDVEEGFMKREMDKESRDQMLRNLKQKELEIKNRLTALKGEDIKLEPDGDV